MRISHKPLILCTSIISIPYSYGLLALNLSSHPHQYSYYILAVSYKFLELLSQFADLINNVIRLLTFSHTPHYFV